MASHPSEISPAFTTPRLKLLVSTIARVRGETLEGHEPEKGENPWTFGCRAYSRTCFAFAELSRSGEHPWLEVKVDGLSCTLGIEGEPIKFYCGEAERPNERSLRRGMDEAVLQGKFPFFQEELAGADDDWFWLMAIETREDGTAHRVAVLQANSKGDTRNTWFVPLEEDVLALAAVRPGPREGVDLSPPAVGPRWAAPRAVSSQDRDQDRGGGLDGSE